VRRRQHVEHVLGAEAGAEHAGAGLGHRQAHRILTAGVGA
jgi:hypothetical protein